MKITFAAKLSGKSVSRTPGVGDAEVTTDTRTPQEKRCNTRAANLQKERDEAAALEAKGLMQSLVHVF